MQLTSASVIESPAHAWFLDNLPEIRSRTRACVCRLQPEQREDATAEVMASVFKAGVNAARRGVLHRVTPYHAVVFALKRYRRGRWMAGYSSTDVTSEATQLRGRCSVTPLSALKEGPRHAAGRDAKADNLSEALACRRVGDPYEQVRQKLDYDCIFDRERVSPKARRLFGLLSAVRGQGHVSTIATMLGVSPGRVCQLKDQLATALAKHGYCPG